MNHPRGRRRHDCWQNDFREYARYKQKTLFMLQKAYSCMTRVPHSSPFHGSRRVQTAFHSDPIPEEKERKMPIVKGCGEGEAFFSFPFFFPLPSYREPDLYDWIGQHFRSTKEGEGRIGCRRCAFCAWCGIRQSQFVSMED